MRLIHLKKGGKIGGKWIILFECVVSFGPQYRSDIYLELFVWQEMKDVCLEELLCVNLDWIYSP